MPLYEYRCPNGHEFEKFFRSIGSAEARAECPTCAEVAERMLSAAGLVFKGSGFYITDYGKDGKKAEREAAASDKEKTAASLSDSKAKSETKGETKNETKSDSAPAAEKKSAESGPAPAAAPKSEPAKPSPKKTTSE
ncbi:MAG TPA: FmdB family zinc ribbon protein [Gemmatimonadaceae bacterium]|nr:FmdB family zinc ribbon protein [Gemmatimonadaceae bacterium]